MLYKSLNNSYLENKILFSPISVINQEKSEKENYCFDCGHGNPELISINNGILICEKCGINHKTFPPGTSILIKNEKNTLSETEQQFLLLGGNQKLFEYILNENPTLINLPRKVLYTSPILNCYRKKLCDLVEKVSMNKVNYANIKYNDSVSQSPNTYYMDKKFQTINDKNKIIYNKFLNDNESKMNNIIDNINKIELPNIFFKNNRKFNKYRKILLNKSNVIYNKPKLHSIFNKIKTEKKEYNKEVKIIRPKIARRLFNYKTSFNNSYVNSKDNNYSMNTSLEKATIPSEDNNMYKYSSKTLNINKNMNKYDIFRAIKVNKNITSEKIGENNCKNRNIKLEKNDYSYLNSLTKYQEVTNKNIKNRRKIREIIINKKMNNSNSFTYDNYLNTVSFQDIRRPIQVNLSLQNTIDNSQNNYFPQFRFNETPTIIIHNTSTNSTEKDAKNKNKKIFRTMSENVIKTININMAKNIKIKNIKSDTGTHLKYITVMKKDNLKPKGNKESIKKDNVDQFQILPVKTYRKINNNKKYFTNLEANKDNRNQKDEKDFNKKRRKISPYKSEINYGKRNENSNYNNAFIKNKKLKKKMVSSSLKVISVLNKGETFINSIRNKYKREKSKHN